MKLRCRIGLHLWGVREPTAILGRKDWHSCKLCGMRSRY